MKHREIFFAHRGPGPYTCRFCKNEVTIEEVSVHHNDGNHSNNSHGNLEPAHDGCHTTYHNNTRDFVLKHTPEAKAKIVAALYERWSKPGSREAQSKKLRGNPKMIEAAARRWEKPEEHEKQRQASLRVHARKRKEKES